LFDSGPVAQPPGGLSLWSRLRWGLALGAIAGLMAGTVGLAGDLTVTADVVPASLTGIDVDGKSHRFAAAPSCKATVVVFLSTTCPISNAALPELKSLATTFRPKKIEFFGVVSDPTLNRQAAVQHRDEYHIPFPVLFDGSMTLRRAMQPTHTPQAVILSPDGTVLYSGRINDRYAAVNVKRDAAAVHDLERALKAIVDGKPIPTPRTKPVGCLLESPPEENATGSVTYHRDIAPLINANCIECHRPGESGPFSLQKYADVAAHAQQIAAVAESKVMPPWHPSPGFGHFRDKRGLNEGDRTLFRQWVATGLPEGDSRDGPPSPKFTTGWRLGTPDLILKMDQPFTVPADGPDVYQHFVLPTGMRHNRLVSAVEFRPGNRRVVHHAAFYVDNAGRARELDQRDPQPGYGGFSGPGFVNYNTLRSWLPGMTPQRLPRGTGQMVPAGSDLVLEIHYQPSGKAETDQSTIGVFFAESSAKKLVHEMQVMNKGLSIPPGESRHHHTASYTLPVTATLLDAAPHMHVLGREMKATATRPDGTVIPLVWIENWDFRWQGQYLYVEPIRLPKGTRIDVDAWYDNSAANPLNPHSPPQWVHWGEQTSEEMGLCHFRYLCDTPDDLRTLMLHHKLFVDRQQVIYRDRTLGRGDVAR
jgi:hypothetical protein